MIFFLPVEIPLIFLEMQLYWWWILFASVHLKMYCEYFLKDFFSQGWEFLTVFVSECYRCSSIVFWFAWFYMRSMSFFSLLFLVCNVSFVCHQYFFRVVHFQLFGNNVYFICYFKLLLGYSEVWDLDEVLYSFWKILSHSLMN